MKLVSRINSQKKTREDVKRKPDPMSREPGLRRDIDRLNTQAHTLVCFCLRRHQDDLNFLREKAVNKRMNPDV